MSFIPFICIPQYDHCTTFALLLSLLIATKISFIPKYAYECLNNKDSFLHNQDTDQNQEIVLQ